MLFVSLVGTQTFSILNPFLAANKNLRIKKVAMLCTKYTGPYANSLKSRMEQENTSVDVHTISNALVSVSGDLPSCVDVFKKILADSDGIIFNLAGGMNYQIGACLLEADLSKCSFLYPEQAMVHHIVFHSDNTIENTHFKVASLEDVLKMQHVPFSSVDAEDIIYKLEKQEMKTVFQRIGLQKILNDPRYQPIKIRDVNFHMFWNNGNHLNFLRVIKRSMSDDQTRRDYLAEARKLIELANNRNAFGELYDREIGLITNDKPIAERIGTEAPKIRVFLTGTIPETNAAAADLKEFVIGAFCGENAGVETIELLNPLPAKNSTALILALGENVTNTYNTIWSHNTAHVILLYTPHDKNIQRLVQAIKKYKKLIPAARITLYPVDIAGLKILDLPKPDAEDIQVNISPGTKGQAAFLSLWARKYGAKVYTNDKGFLKRLDDFSFASPMKAPPPNSYLHLAGFLLNSSGNDISLQIHKKYKFMIDFCRVCIKSNINLIKILYNTIKVNGYKWKIGKKGERVLYVAGQKKQFKFSISDGKWFEQVVGYAIKDCGADDVQVRIRTDWNADLRKIFIERNKLENEGHKIFMTDLDVSARFGSHYYLISCKTNFNQDNLDHDITEAEAMAKLFGRFGIPMYCVFDYLGEPNDLANKNVFVFGPKTLTNSKAMKQLITRARENRQTTRAI